MPRFIVVYADDIVLIHLSFQCWNWTPLTTRKICRSPLCTV